MLLKRFLLAAAGVAALGLATGCDPLTRDRFDMIVVDVSNQADVRHTIGKPTYVRDDQWHFERPARHLNVLVDFNPEGTVTRKQWIDAARNEWVDSQPAQEGARRESTRVRTKR